MTTSTKCAVAAVIIMALPTFLGCGGDTPPPNNPNGAGSFTPPPPPVPPPPPPPPPPVAAAPCDSVVSLGLSTMLKGRAGTEAPNMKPEGAEVCMSVPEGQAVTSAVGLMMEPGHCYTVLAQGGPGVNEVELKLAADFQGAVPPAFAALAQNPVLGQDTETGPAASIGGKTACYAWAWPVAGLVKVTATAKSGTGPISVQVYKKKK